MSNSSSRAPVEVVFEDPDVKRQAAAVKAGHKRPRPDDSGARSGTPAAAAAGPALSTRFHDVYREVTGFGAAGFQTKDKKQWEAKQNALLGIRSTRKEKMPLKMWLGVKKGREKRAALAAERAAASQVITGKAAHKASKKRERFVAKPGQTLNPRGFKDGVLRVPGVKSER